MSVPRPTSLIALTLVLAGCGSTESPGPGGAVIALTPDTTRNTPQQVLGQLARVELMIDARGGFKNLSVEVEGFSVVDADGDSEDELLLAIEPPGDRLPEVFLAPGSNRDTEIAIRARGLDEKGRVAAYGGVEAQQLFFERTVDRVEVPFNLSRSHLPPRIIAVAPESLPADMFPRSVRSIAFYSSRALDPVSLERQLRVLVQDSKGWSATVKKALVRRACAGGVEMWTYTPECRKASAVKLMLGAGVTAADGAPLEGPFERLLDLSLAQIGECPPIACSASSPLSAPGARCAAGHWRPTACTLVASACSAPWEVFGWTRGEENADCEAHREGTMASGGFCVVQKPWPCYGDFNCPGTSLGGCVDDHCKPATCTDSCPGADPSLLCVPTRGCLPRIGTCAEDCTRFGGCPDFEERCDKTERVCR
jgi:hypothetical protein